MAKKRSASSARGRRVAASAQPPDSQIDFSDIPEASPAQLKAMRRVGRPPLGDKPRTIIAIRLDQKLLTAFRKEARRRQMGYQTLIHEVLTTHIKQAS